MTNTPQSLPKIIALVVFPGVEPLDVTGPASVFAKAQDAHPGAYEVVLLSAEGGTVKADGAVSFADTTPFARAPHAIDTLLVAGGSEAGLLGAVAAGAPAWIAAHAGCRRVGSICTGAFLLAAAGLLDGCEATTHWRAAKKLSALFPTVKVRPDPLYVHDRVFTSAGVTAGIDLSLALVAADHGQALANTVARELVVYSRRAGGQLQYSQVLEAQVSAQGVMADLVAWILDHLDRQLSGPKLAQRAHMSERTFARRFVQATGEAPSRFIMRARVDRALMLLETTPMPIDRVASAVGLGSVDALQRAFRSLGLGPPSSHRLHFGPSPQILPHAGAMADRAS